MPRALFVALVHLSAAKGCLLALAGLGAGLFNGVAGGGTLISFPALLAAGYPALVANMTSSVGIFTSYVGSVAGFRTELAGQRARLRMLSPVAAVGGLGGAALLLSTPSQSFDRMAPWLVLGATLLFAAGPTVGRLLTRSSRVTRTHPVGVLLGIGAASIYGGYFGAAMGVVILAVLGLGLPDTLLRSSGLRAMLSVLVNAVAAAAFLVHGSLAWAAIGLLTFGSLLGGYLGARLARRLPSPWFRTLIVCTGLATGIRLLVG